MNGVFLFRQSIRTPICDITVFAEENAVVKIELCRYDTISRPNDITEQCCKEINEYFSGTRKRFDVPIHPEGSPFSLKIWEALQEIPYGETISYKELASRAGNPKAYRAAGNANHSNPLPILIPCHRVIAADGTVGGYAYPIAIKEKLLSHEKDNRI